jgi:hypothetical protein
MSGKVTELYTNSQKGNRLLQKQSERLQTSIQTVKKVTDFYSQKGYILLYKQSKRLQVCNLSDCLYRCL